MNLAHAGPGRLRIGLAGLRLRARPTLMSWRLPTVVLSFRPPVNGLLNRDWELMDLSFSRLLFRAFWAVVLGTPELHLIFRLGLVP